MTNSKTETTNILVQIDKIWFEPAEKGAILMVMTNSPFVGSSDFEAPIRLGEQEFTAKFSFSGAVSFEGENISRALFRATELSPVHSQSPSKSEMRLNLSGPRLPSPSLSA